MKDDCGISSDTHFGLGGRLRSSKQRVESRTWALIIPHQTSKLVLQYFSDLGLEDADGLSTRTSLAIQVMKMIREKGLRQKEAGKLLGLKQ